MIDQAFVQKVNDHGQELITVNTQLAEKASMTYVDDEIAKKANGAPKGVYTTVTALQNAFPTGDLNNYLVTGNVKEVASLTISAAPTASGNVTVTLDGLDTNIAVTKGVAEVVSLTISAVPTTAGNVTVTLNGVATNIAVDPATDTTTDTVATKIRNTAFSEWTTGGTGSTITFTANSVGVKTDSTYSAGTTGASGTMSTTTQGVDADTATTVATKIRGTAFSGWTTGGTGTNVTFTATTAGTKTDSTYSAGSTGATGTMSTATQGVNADGQWYYWNGSAWAAGGLYQATGIADNSVDSAKVVRKSLGLEKLSDLVFEFLGDEVYTNQTDLTRPHYYGLSFDTDGLSLPDNADIEFELDFITEDNNVSFIHARLFMNNDSNATATTGGIINTASNGRTSVLINEVNKFNVKYSTKYSTAYRYVKPYLCLELIDNTQFTTFYVTNIKCKVNGVDLVLVEKKLLQASIEAYIVQKTKQFDWQLSQKKDLKDITAAKLADGVIENLYSPPGENLFNPNNATNGKYLDNYDVEQTLSSYSYSDYIPVTPGETYEHYAVSNTGATKFLYEGCYYDSNNVLVGAFQNIQLPQLWTAPEGVYKVRINTAVDQQGVTYFKKHGERKNLSWLTVNNDNYEDKSITKEKLADGVIPVLLSRWNGKKANFLGDSITAGLYYNGSGYSTAKQYHQWLKDLLGLSVARNYGSSGTHISGAYTSDGSSDPTKSFTARYTSMDNDADLIVVFGGTNDYGHATTAPFGTMTDRTDISFYGALHYLMGELTKKYLGKTIVFMTPLHRDNETNANTTTGKTLKDYVNAIKEVAEYYGIHVIDTYKIGGMSTVIPEIKTTYINDGLHPNEAGHEFLGNRLAPIFNVL